MGIALRGTGKVVVSRYGRFVVVRHTHVFDPIDIYTQVSSISPHNDDVMPLIINKTVDFGLRVILFVIVINEKFYISIVIISKNPSAKCINLY